MCQENECITESQDVSGPPLKLELPPDFPSRIKRLRDKFGLTQMRLAELMGVSFASVNRWENGQSRPSALAWQQITRAEVLDIAALGTWSDVQSLGRSTAADEDSNQWC
jgi:transcriptional regulator with XRE-family HTH domain